MAIWPKKSGQVKHFPEIDKGEFFDPPSAKNKMLPAEVPFLDRLAEKFPQESSDQAPQASQALLGI
jgi:predicted NUDIX family NTP pyrophosphohydrolase